MSTYRCIPHIRWPFRSNLPWTLVLPTDKNIAPSKLVAQLKVRKVKADVPLVLEARAQRSTSIVHVVNSARKNSVNCDRAFKIRILRPGLLATNDAICGCSKELL